MLKKILATVVAGSLAATMALSASAETTTVEKTLFTGDGTVAPFSNTDITAPAFTEAEAAAAMTEGAKFELVVEFLDDATVPGGLNVTLFNPARNMWGSPAAMTIDAKTAKISLNFDQVYIEDTDEFNRGFRFTAVANGWQTSPANVLIKSATLVITYEAGEDEDEEDEEDSLDITDALDPDEEPEFDFDFEEDDFVEDEGDEFGFEDEGDDWDDEDEDDDLWLENDDWDDDVDEEIVIEEPIVVPSPKTGVAFAIVPALIAGAIALVARKKD